MAPPSQSNGEASGARLESLQLRIPEGVSYNCQGCGRCCTGHAVGLTEADYERVSGIDWSSLQSELAGRELFVHKQDDYDAGRSRFPHFTKAREDGSCSFLIDNRCFIHEHLGEESKPGGCRLFPYTFVSTPTGIFVGVVYDSNAAVRNLGQPLAHQKDMLHRMWAVNVAHHGGLTGAAQEALAKMSDLAGPTPAAAPGFKVSLSNGLPISWAEYEIVESRLIESVHGRQWSNFLQGLIAASEIVCEAVRLRRQGEPLDALRSFEPAVEPWLKAEPGVFEKLVFHGISFRNFAWPMLRVKRRDLWLGARQNPLSDKEVMASVVKTVFHKKMDLPEAGEFKIEAAFSEPFEPLSDEVLELLRRYFYLRVFSKTYFSIGSSGLSLLAGMNNMIGNIASALVFGKGMAMHRNSRSLAPADLYEAFFLLDKELVALTVLPGGAATVYDIGFSSLRLFNRLVGKLAGTIGA